MKTKSKTSSVVKNIAPVKVKICGITEKTDAVNAVRLGVDALGFNFYSKSPRYIKPEKAEAIIRALPPFVSTVALFVNADIDSIYRVLGNCRIDYIQFHGEEDPAFVGQFPKDKVIKALGVNDRWSLKKMDEYKFVNNFLLDAYAPKIKGGSGKTFKWSLANAVKSRSRNILLAGGLTPLNVAQAVKEVRPWAVDVASGVEKKKGVKDIGKMRAFIENAKKA